MPKIPIGLSCFAGRKIPTALAIAVICFLAIFQINKTLILSLENEEPNGYYFKEVGSMLTFLKSGSGLCSEILAKSNIDISKDMSAYNNKKEKVVGDTSTDKKNSNNFPVLQTVNWYITQLPFVKTICATTLEDNYYLQLWLSGSRPHTHIHVFTPVSYQDSKRKSVADIQQIYGRNRLNVTWGDPSETLPNFIKEFPQFKCDMFVLGDDYTSNELEMHHINFRNMASKVNIVLTSGYPGLRSKNGKAVGRAWGNMKLKGYIMEYTSCSTSDLTLGLSIGQYNLF